MLVGLRFATITERSHVAVSAALLWSIANNVLRESVFVPAFGAPTALVLCGLLLSSLIVALTYFSLPWLNLRRPVGPYTVGAGWLALTLAFEFSLGLWQGKSWRELFDAYTFHGGNIWPVVLATTAFAPRIASKPSAQP
tara:strand:- start:343 stop:759 length:417 start_codon:yes stop_codon:yes gene_type:complete